MFLVWINYDFKENNYRKGFKKKS